MDINNLDLNKLAQLLEYLEQNIDKDELEKIKKIIKDGEINEDNMEEISEFIKTIFGDMNKN
jgi:ribosome recycling factor